MSEPSAADTFARFRSRFFASYMSTQPEEATTLGLHSMDDRLKDCSPAALDAELAFYKAIERDLDGIPEDALPVDEKLDLWTVLRIARFHIHAHEIRKAHCRNLELSVYPYSMLQYQIAQAETASDWAAITARTGGVALFLKQQEDNLERGIAEGTCPDRTLARFFAEDQLPAIERYFDGLAAIPGESGFPLDNSAMERLREAARAAGTAFRSHAVFLREKVVPRAGDGFALGEAEVRWRLENVLGITAEPSDLVRQAQEILAQLQAEIVRLAARLGPSVEGAPSSVSTLTEAREVVTRILSPRTEREADILPLYEDILRRATRFVKEKHLFHIPEGFELGMKPIPPGMAAGTNATNWPAPLLDPRKKGYFLVAREPSWHPLAGAANLAVHEGIPGHYLQSLAFQRAFHGHPSPVRFLLVADDVAMARGYFGPMLNIEGYAAYAEELMLANGFYSEPEALFATVSEAIRAMRVVVDLSLHTGRMTPDDAARFIVETTCMPEGWARQQVLRYMRIPLQAITYLLGKLEIERLKNDCQSEEGSRFDEADFHDRFFSFGPALPALLRRAMRCAP